jgi:hypothetical protein
MRREIVNLSLLIRRTQKLRCAHQVASECPACGGAPEPTEANGCVPTWRMCWWRALKISLEMIARAQQAEYDYYAERGLLAFKITPEPVIKAMLEAAFAGIPDEVAATLKPAAIVRALRPLPRRGR